MPPKQTLAQRQLARTRAELERDAKRRDREKLRTLRTEIKAARSARTERVRGVRDVCRAERQRLKLRAQQARQRLRDSIARMRAQARDLCAVQLHDARAETGQHIAQAVEALDKERGYQASLNAWTRPDVCAVPKGRSARERREESDCEVAANIDDPGLRAVWEKVKRKIKGSARQSRTEAFLQWVHDNSADVERIQYDAEEQAIKQLIREETKMRKAMEKPDRYRKKTKEELAEILADVPF